MPSGPADYLSSETRSAASCLSVWFFETTEVMEREDGWIEGEREGERDGEMAERGRKRMVGRWCSARSWKEPTATLQLSHY